MKQSVKDWVVLILIGGAVMLLDQGAKALVVHNLDVGQSWNLIPAISDFIRITRSQNMGAAFGFLPQAADIFLVLAIVTVAAIILYYPRLPSHAWLSHVSIAMVCGGALSNALDRIRLGHVVDFVHVQLTPEIANISNFADHAITLGVALMLIDQWRAERAYGDGAHSSEESAPDSTAASEAVESGFRDREAHEQYSHHRAEPAPGDDRSPGPQNIQGV
jgi:signal peptidase II